MNHGIKKHVSLDLISLEKFILILYLHLAVESKVGKKLYNQLDRKYMTRVPTVDNQGGKKSHFLLSEDGASVCSYCLNLEARNLTS